MDDGTACRMVLPKWTPLAYAMSPTSPTAEFGLGAEIGIAQAPPAVDVWKKSPIQMDYRRFRQIDLDMNSAKI